MSNQIKIFMAQKQKLKSERGNLNVGIKDMFMTMDPEAFRIALEMLATLRDSDKDGFNLVLEKFQVLKNSKEQNQENILTKMKFRNKVLNLVVDKLLIMYWLCKIRYDGGYFWRMMPKKKANESEAQFDIRRKRMEDNLMQVMLDVLDDCDYYIKGTQNSQKTQK